MPPEQSPSDALTDSVEETVTEELVEETDDASPHPRTRQTTTKTVRKSTFRNGKLIKTSFFKKTVVRNASRALRSLSDDLLEVARAQNTIDENTVVNDTANGDETNGASSSSIDGMDTNEARNLPFEPNAPVTPTPTADRTIPASPAHEVGGAGNPTRATQASGSAHPNDTIEGSTSNTGAANRDGRNGAPSSNIDAMDTTETPNRASKRNASAHSIRPPVSTAYEDGDAGNHATPSTQAGNSAPSHVTFEAAMPNTDTTNDQAVASDAAQQRTMPSRNAAHSSREQADASSVHENASLPPRGLNLTSRSRQPYQHIPLSNHVQSLARDTSSYPDSPNGAHTIGNCEETTAAQLKGRSVYKDMPAKSVKTSSGMWCVRALNGSSNFYQHSKECHGFFATRREAIKRAKAILDADVHDNSYADPCRAAKLEQVEDLPRYWEIRYSGGSVYDCVIAQRVPEREGRWTIKMLCGHFGNPKRNISPKTPDAYWVGPFPTMELALIEGKNQMAYKSKITYQELLHRKDFYVQDCSGKKWSVLWSPPDGEYVKVVVTTFCSLTGAHTSSGS